MLLWRLRAPLAIESDVLIGEKVGVGREPDAVADAAASAGS